MDAHVIGYEIQNETEIVGLESRTQPVEGVFTAKLRIERVVVNDVIAVRAAAPCFQEWRCIKMRDA